jgi:hydroxymethylglutaryl-CoA synthase
MDDNLNQKWDRKEQPVFDGQYSNQCYMDRTRAAYSSSRRATHNTLYYSWKVSLCIYPMLFRRRMLTEIYALDSTHMALTRT